MTREEIKDELYRMLSDVVNGGYPIRNNAQKGRYREAVKEAIKALSSSENPNTCGDAISRQAVDDAIYDYSRSCNVDYSQIMEYIEKLPSVTPQQRTGRWMQKEEEGDAEPFIIWECSECHEYQRKQTTFCPNCGARMEVEE